MPRMFLGPVILLPLDIETVTREYYWKRTTINLSSYIIHGSIFFPSFSFFFFFFFGLVCMGKEFNLCMHLFTTAAVSNCQKLSSLKQYVYIISHFWGSEVQVGWAVLCSRSHKAEIIGSDGLDSRAHLLPSSYRLLPEFSCLKL